MGQLLYTSLDPSKKTASIIIISFREKQREATERYQRAHIPHRRRFSSPVLDKAYSAPALTAESNLHSLSDTRFQSPNRPKSSLVTRTEVEKHSARTAQSRAAFKDQFVRQPGPAYNPSPPTYPRPALVKTAWDTETQTPFFKEG